MLFKSTVTLLLASLAVAAPVKAHIIKMSLLGERLPIHTVLKVPMDGTPVSVTENDQATPVIVMKMECIGICIRPHHCTLYDKDLAPIVKVKTPQSLFGKFYEVRQVSCEYEPVPTQQLDATEALATEP